MSQSKVPVSDDAVLSVRGYVERAIKAVCIRALYSTH
jgi:hypothetical protein